MERVAALSITMARLRALEASNGSAWSWKPKIDHIPIWVLRDTSGFFQRILEV